MCPPLQHTPLTTALEQLRSHNHLCSIYESRQEHFGVAIPFIRIGLERGDKCIYIADDDTVGDVRDVMQAEGIDVDRAAASKSLVIATKAEAYLNRLPFDPDWMLTFWKEATARAMSEGFPALRVTAETEWVLQGASGLERWMQYESRLTRAVSEINCIALCQYNRRLFPSEVILDVIRTHPIVVSGGTVCRNMYYVPADQFLGPDQASREVERLLINIREREQVEHHLRAQRDELRTSEHRFRLMVEGVKDYGLFMLDTEGRVISWNAGAERIKGYREEEILGRHVSRFYSPEEVAQGKIDEELRIAVTSGQFQGEGWRIRKDGSRFFSEFLIAPVRDEAGELVGFLKLTRDITERKQAEASLREAQDRVEMIVNSITDNFFGLDKDWRFTYLNKHAQEQMKVLGKDPARLIGKVLWEEFPSVPNEEVLRRVMSERIVMIDELYYPPLGEWVENHIYPSPDGGLVTFQRYVTRRKRAERELLRSQGYLAEGQRLSHTGSWAWNVSSGELFWAPEVFRIFGLDPTNTPVSHSMCLQRIHSDDRPFLEEMFERAIRERAEYQADCRVIRPDGMIRHLRALGHPAFNESGDLIEYVGTVMDVTERKLAEDKLRRSEAHLAEGQRLSRTGSWAWNASSGQLFWSDEQFRMFGLDPESATPTLSMVMQFIHPDDRSFVQQALDKAVREKTDHEWDCRIVTTDGTVKHVHTTAHPVFESGQLMEYVGITMDVTQRMQADLQLRQLSGRLLQLQDDERRRLARELHDSTGQTLTGLSLRLAVVEDEIASLSSGARQALVESASLLDQASRELRSLSYLLHPPFLDDSGLRSAVPWYVHGFSHRSGIQVQVDLPSAMGRLPGDLETTLFRIIQEGLTNILKHSGSQTASLRIVLNENEVTLEISDQGKGLPVEILNTPSNLVSGVGIGIMGMRERVRQLHGRLEITSGAWGTKVKATLPLNERLG